MSPSIVVLPGEVADQIAAGEVVERPASVVKELIENALDAGATRIEVEVEDGGKRMIRVADDGGGMEPQDAALAIDRHATSKIRRTADLVGVPTYGFRGEALPAIGSVAQLQLDTAPGQGDATTVRVIGGRLESVETTTRAQGTTVVVRNLFFNTPARRKFLRASRTEQRAISDAVHLYALGSPDVGFRLVADGRVLLDAAPGETREERIAASWGRRIADSLLPIEAREGPLGIAGFIQRPAEAAPAGRRVQLFVNGRPFRDHFLIRAAEAGYSTTIAPGNRPSMVLFLTLPGSGVDVNVHPAKLEVRFRDRRWIEDSLSRAVRSTLGSLASAAAAGSWGIGPGPAGGAGADAGVASLLPLGQRELWLDDTSETAASAGNEALLQVFDSYIVFASDADLVFVDQHSAQERILYEKAMHALTTDGAGSQRLLMPFTVDLVSEELEAVEAHRDLLQRIGFELEPFGGQSLVVHAVPNPHPRFDARRCLEELAADLGRGRFGGWSNRLQRFAATYGCRAAIKAGHRLSAPEMRELIDALLVTDLPPHDVHGRPTVIRLPRDELERRFGRR